MAFLFPIAEAVISPGYLTNLLLLLFKKFWSKIFHFVTNNHFSSSLYQQTCLYTSRPYQYQAHACFILTYLNANSYLNFTYFPYLWDLFCHRSSGTVILPLPLPNVHFHARARRRCFLTEQLSRIETYWSIRLHSS